MRTMLNKLCCILLALNGFATIGHAQHKSDTLRISNLFTTHIIFNTDLIYADISNSQVMAAKILEQSRNMMALKARTSFTTPLSVSALESNGLMHTFIVMFDDNPCQLVYDIRQIEAKEHEEMQYSDTTSTIKKHNRKHTKDKKNRGTALYRKSDAPLLKDVVASGQSLWHISDRQYDIDVMCTNILTYSDVTYLVFELKNHSGVSYECGDATFVVESKNKIKKSVVYDKNIFPKSRYGTISCAPDASTKIGYSLDKLSLSKDQILKVYFYESGGQRELVLTINSADINKAKTKL